MKNTKIIVKNESKSYPIYFGNEILYLTGSLIKKKLPGFYKTDVMPPSTIKVEPVMYEAASEAKKATVFATSSPVPNLDIGILEVSMVLIFSAILSFIFDLINPGDTQLMLIFFFAYSIARDLDIPIMPAFEAE